MILRIISIYIFIFSLASAETKEVITKFQGSYVSDKKATIPEVKKVKGWNEKLQKLVIDQLGELRITIKGNITMIQYGEDGDIVNLEYKVLEHGKDWLLLTLDESQPLKYRIVIDDDGFWQTIEGGEVTFRERFRRIK